MESIWMKDYVEKNLPSIDKDISTPILIIGGGISGLICAYYFMKNNIKFILVEARKLATGVSASTTAQLSIAHDKIYDDIETKHSKDKSLLYLKSQMEGLELIRNIIKTENIQCDYKEESTILGANEKQNIKVLENQFKLINEINKNCNLLSDQKDIIDYTRGIEFKQQAIFNPMKYMMSVIDVLLINNISLYENSRVTKIKKNDRYSVTINDNFIIQTDKIVMACHYPILNPDNLYFAKIFQSCSYAVVFKTKLKLKANYVFLDKPYYYLRTYNDEALIIGGNDHFTGSNTNIEQCYKDLIDKIQELDKDAKIIDQWFTEDCMPIDSLPFIGKYSRFHPDITLITGFQKWGFTNAHMAALNVTNMLLGKEYNNLYKTNRWTMFTDLKSSFRMIAHSVNGLVLSKLFIKEYKLDDIKVGSGKVTRFKNNNVLVYRESEKDFVILKNKCTHMGCSLIWNDVDKVWESKCHGSIFDRYGHVLHGPALKDLERI